VCSLQGLSLLLLLMYLLPSHSQTVLVRVDPNAYSIRARAQLASVGLNALLQQ
jgi:hypothetical protein